MNGGNDHEMGIDSIFSDIPTWFMTISGDFDLGCFMAQLLAIGVTIRFADAQVMSRGWFGGGVNFPFFRLRFPDVATYQHGK